MLLANAPPVLHLFFRCIHCRSESCAVRAREFPLCELCASFLTLAPPLCQGCGGFCEKTCLKFPPDERLIDSYSALYLLIEPGYSVLRTWKKAGGPAFDRKVLRWDRTPPELAQAEAIVPIPQRLARTWRLGRSPAWIISQALSIRLTIPVRELLGVAPSLGKRQAERSIAERLQTEIRFEGLYDGDPPGSVVLVDDFMTSGRTLRQAAAVLRLLGVRRVHTFCLGVRPLRRHEPQRIERRHHLLERC